MSFKLLKQVCFLLLHPHPGRRLPSAELDPPAKQDNDKTSAPLSPTAYFPVIRFLLQLLAAPLVAGSFFLLPVSIAQVSQNDSSEGNRGIIINIIENGLAIGAVSGGSISILLWNRILSKTKKINENTMKLDKEMRDFRNEFQSKIKDVSINIQKQKEDNVKTFINYMKETLKKVETGINRNKDSLYEIGKINKEITGNTENIKTDTEGIIRRLDEKS